MSSVKLSRSTKSHAVQDRCPAQTAVRRWSIGLILELGRSAHSAQPKPRQSMPDGIDVNQTKRKLAMAVSKNPNVTLVAAICRVDAIYKDLERNPK
jgi:hypothetical protein